jgi:hypothetical protein
MRKAAIIVLALLALAGCGSATATTPPAHASSSSPAASKPAASKPAPAAPSSPAGITPASVKAFCWANPYRPNGAPVAATRQVVGVGVDADPDPTADVGTVVVDFPGFGKVTTTDNHPFGYGASGSILFTYEIPLFSPVARISLRPVVFTGQYGNNLNGRYDVPCIVKRI